MDNTFSFLNGPDQSVPSAQWGLHKFFAINHLAEIVSVITLVICLRNYVQPMRFAQFGYSGEAFRIPSVGLAKPTVVAELPSPYVRVTG